jgi:8-oxo-dGTP pyrophosphatase MutT (NUDIX family)
MDSVSSMSGSNLFKTHFQLDLKPSQLDSSKNHLVSSVIFKRTQPTQILVVKRTDSEDSFPGVWKIPGGHVEASDITIRAALERETSEETGLHIKEVLSRVEDLAWTSASGKEKVQYVFIVTVEEGIIKLNPGEHTSWHWLSESDIDSYNITLQMKKVLLDSFHTLKSNDSIINFDG